MATEKRLIDANADNCGEVTKIKTHYARIVVDGTAEKPYYSIEWYDPTKKEYFLGYSSYYIGNVFNWLSECFEIVEYTTVDAVEVVRCKDCIHRVKRSWAKCAGRKPDDFCSDGVRRFHD